MADSHWERMLNSAGDMPPEIESKIKELMSLVKEVKSVKTESDNAERRMKTLVAEFAQRDEAVDHARDLFNTNRNLAELVNNMMAIVVHGVEKAEDSKKVYEALSSDKRKENYEEYMDEIETYVGMSKAIMTLMLIDYYGEDVVLKKKGKK